jgi:lysine 2,3-aminomutase
MKKVLSLAGADQALLAAVPETEFSEAGTRTDLLRFPTIKPLDPELRARLAGWAPNPHGFHVVERAFDLIDREGLLPHTLIDRLEGPRFGHLLKPRPVEFKPTHKFDKFRGIDKLVESLAVKGIAIDDDQLAVMRAFAHVYRFKLSGHFANQIDWAHLDTDPLSILVVPQPGMIESGVVENIKAAEAAIREAKLTGDTDTSTAAEAALERIVQEYITETNPFNGKQQLNVAVIKSPDGTVDLVEGTQHKYEQTMLIFPKTGQDCAAFCTYCFRAPQLRGGDDKFSSERPEPALKYVAQHNELRDLLITGGDSSTLTTATLRSYLEPIMHDRDSFGHITKIRLGTRYLSYNPFRFLTQGDADDYMKLVRELTEAGIEVNVMAHFSNIEELTNPFTIAAIRRLGAAGAKVMSQSPIMKGISAWRDEDGALDLDRSAQNWVDIAELLGAVGARWYSMYLPRATGPKNFFDLGMADSVRVFNEANSRLSGITRPLRQISGSVSAGKIGVEDIDEYGIFTMRFVQSRNPDWQHRKFYATPKVGKSVEDVNWFDDLQPCDRFEHPLEKWFFEYELADIEAKKQALIDLGMPRLLAAKAAADEIDIEDFGPALVRA